MSAWSDPRVQPPRAELPAGAIPGIVYSLARGRSWCGELDLKVYCLRSNLSNTTHLVVETPRGRRSMGISDAELASCKSQERLHRWHQLAEACMVGIETDWNLAQQAHASARALLAAKAEEVARLHQEAEKQRLEAPGSEFGPSSAGAKRAMRLKGSLVG